MAKTCNIDGYCDRVGCSYLNDECICSYEGQCFYQQEQIKNCNLLGTCEHRTNENKCIYSYHCDYQAQQEDK